MFGTYFYNETIKRCVSVFGTMFNNIQYKKVKSDGTVLTSPIVPLSYGPKQKFLDRIAEEPNLSDKNRSAISLPRMAFELTGFEYDVQRQQNKLHRTIKSASESDGKRGFQYAPAPYNLNFTLSILTKNMNDALQIVEQILPFFQPDYTLTINDMADMGIKRDVPIILNDVSYEDSYQGDFESRRAIIYTLGFTTKFYLYGPVTSSSVIKTVQVDQYADLPSVTPTREQRYSVAPKPVTADADDDFGFNETSSFFVDAKNFDPVSGTDKLKEGNR